MENQVNKLLKRLAFLGYCSYQIQTIVREVADCDNWAEIDPSHYGKLISHLEMYEQLGAKFLEAYSK